MLASEAPLVTMTVAKPAMVPMLARTVFVKVPAAVPDVNNPVVVPIEPPPATMDQTGTIGITLPTASCPTAVYCWLTDVASVTGVGVTVMVASAPATRVTVAVAVLPPLLTWMVLVKVFGVEPAVNIPLAVIVPPLATTDQTGVIATIAPDSSTPVAVNCCVPLTTTVCGLG